MGDVSFSDRFELFELLREGDVQTFRARERATGQDVEVHLSASPELLAKLEPVIDRGSHDGKLYVVTTPASLDAVGAWRVKQSEKAPPGDFTRMFELRQAPASVVTPAARAVQTPAASQPGEFTQVFKKPAAGSPVAPSSSSAPGQPGEFTRMFQQPVPAPPVPASQTTASSRRIPVGLIVTAVVIISAIAVFVLLRTLY